MNIISKSDRSFSEDFWGKKPNGKKGIACKHECPDWDYLEIDENSPEWECCTCKKENL